MAIANRQTPARSRSDLDHCLSAGTGLFCNMAILLIRVPRAGRNALAGQHGDRPSCLKRQPRQGHEVARPAPRESRAHRVGRQLLLQAGAARPSSAPAGDRNSSATASRAIRPGGVIAAGRCEPARARAPRGARSRPTTASRRAAGSPAAASPPWPGRSGRAPREFRPALTTAHRRLKLIAQPDQRRVTYNGSSAPTQSDGPEPDQEPEEPDPSPRDCGQHQCTSPLTESSRRQHGARLETPPGL